MFQSTPPSREATEGGAYDDEDVAVSIHAPLTGGDELLAEYESLSAFQSTPPSREATYSGSFQTHRLRKFQSTPPSREATLVGVLVVGRRRRFNPRPPHGRRRDIRRDQWTARVSIHAPLTGGDHQPNPS